MRLGLRVVKGLQKAEIEAMLQARGEGFRSVDELAALPGLSRQSLERLAEADAFRSLGLDRRAALWAVRGLDDRRIARTGEETGGPGPLLAGRPQGELFPEPPVTLPPMPLPEHVAEDYVTTSLSLKAHPCAFLRPGFQAMGARPCRDLKGHGLVNGRLVTVAGLVLVRQRPGTAKGICFMTLEDETGSANVIVWPTVFEANRRVAMTGRLIAVRGRYQRQGLVIHVVAESLLDLTHRLQELREGFAPPPDTNDKHVGLDPRALKSRSFH